MSFPLLDEFDAFVTEWRKNSPGGLSEENELRIFAVRAEIWSGHEAGQIAQQLHALNLNNLSRQ